MGKKKKKKKKEKGFNILLTFAALFKMLAIIFQNSHLGFHIQLTYNVALCLFLILSLQLASFTARKSCICYGLCFTANFHSPIKSDNENSKPIQLGDSQGVLLIAPTPTPAVVPLSASSEEVIKSDTSLSTEVAGNTATVPISDTSTIS